MSFRFEAVFGVEGNRRNVTIRLLFLGIVAVRDISILCAHHIAYL